MARRGEAAVSSCSVALDPAPSVRRRSALGRHSLDALLGIVVTLVLLVPLELTLAAAGLGDRSGRSELSRGFDPDAAYLVPDPEVAGGWCTQMMDVAADEKRVPPKGERERVILFGGSNTAGWSPLRLDRALNEGRERPRYEVINLGRSGYGSARVKLLVHQALQRLEPDVVLIYVGHNEFVEKSFLLDLELHASSRWIDDLTARATHLRTVNFVADLFRETRSPHGDRPEAWSWEYGKFQNLTFDQTLVQLEGYRENLRAACTEALEHGARVVLCTVVANDLEAPFGSAFPPAIDEATRESFREKRRAALALLPACFRPLLPERELDRVYGPEWPTEPEGAAAARSPLPGLRPCTGPFATQSPGHPAPERLIPKILTVYQSWEILNTHAFDEPTRARLEQAETLLQEALALCADHPRAIFELALVDYALDRDGARTAQLFHEAGRLDRAPRKGNDTTNRIVREVAAELPDVLLVDAQALFARHMPLGLTGWEWMADYCHLNWGGKIVLLDMLAKAMRERWD